jgi:hypothetical protein
MRDPVAFLDLLVDEFPEQRFDLGLALIEIRDRATHGEEGISYLLSHGGAECQGDEVPRLRLWLGEPFDHERAHGRDQHRKHDHVATDGTVGLVLLLTRVHKLDYPWFR